MSWMFAQRLAGHSVARIVRALNVAGIACPPAADPDRNPHRAGTGWPLGAVNAILRNPRYTGCQVWNRQRTDMDLAGPSDPCLGHKSVQRWNQPDGWVISARPAHPALVSEADFIAAQDVSAARGPAPSAALDAITQRVYQLAGVMACGWCGRRMESAWSNGKSAYRCRHGNTTAHAPDSGRAANYYVREDRVLALLPALHLMLTGTDPVGRKRRRTRGGADVTPSQPAVEDVIGYFREHEITLTWHHAAGTVQAATGQAARTITIKAS